MSVLRTFVLRDADVAARMLAYVKEHAAEAARRGQPLQVTVARYAPPRSNGSNKHLWGDVLGPISEQVSVGGTYYKADIWHEHFKELFLPDVCAAGIEKWVHFADGSRRVAMSTTDLNREEFEVYIEQIRAHAASEYGVVFPPPKDRSTGAG